MTTHDHNNPVAQAFAATPDWMLNIDLYDGLEVVPCKIIDIADGSETVEPRKADFWSVYGRQRSGGVQYLDDFLSEAEAQVFHDWLIAQYPHLAERNLETWLAIGLAHPRIRLAAEPAFSRDSFKACETPGILYDLITGKNWSLGTAFYIGAICFIQQGDGGDEWLAIHESRIVDTVSMRDMSRKPFLSFIERTQHAAVKPCRAVSVIGESDHSGTGETATPWLHPDAYTPTPWYYNQDEGSGPEDGHNINTAEHVICDLPDMGDGAAPHTEGNARFIVRACNAFAGLAGALSDMISDVEAGNTEWTANGTLAYAKRELARAVGARATDSSWLELSNEDRALRAEAALRQFRRETGVGDDREAVGDLIADLGHYCDEQGLDFDELVRRGVEHWRAEHQAGAFKGVADQNNSQPPS